jgi:S1-C subfamily serine protease
MFVVLTLVAGSPVSADAPRALSGHEIVERNKPGVIVIKTLWRGTRLAIAEPGVANGELLNKTIAKQIRSGTVHNTPEGVAHAKLHEIAQNPDLYLTRDPNKVQITETGLPMRGTGFIITPDGYIVTNAHVVSMNKDELIGEEAMAEIERSINKVIHDTDASLSSDDPLRKELERALQSYYVRGWEKGGGIKVLAFDPDQKEVMAVIPVENGIQMTTKKVAADIRNLGAPVPGKDVAILKIEADELPTVPLGDDNIMAQGDQIYILGFPGAAELDPNEEVGVEATLTAGKFSRRAQVPGGIWKFIQTDAYVNHGNSGGPAFDERGEVIGIATYGGKGVNYLVPMSIVKQFIEEKNIKPRDSELSMRYREALANLEARNYSKSKSEFLAIKADSAGFPFVQQYINDLKKLEGQQGYPYGQITIWVAIVGILGIGTWILMNRRAAQPAGAAIPVGGAFPKPRPMAKPLKGEVVQQSYGSLQATAGPLVGQRFPVSKQGLLIGRDPSRCQIVITDDSVSKEHAWVVPLDEAVVLIDRGSANGVYVNSTESPKVSKVPLKHGDKIFVGKSGAASFTYYSA